MADRGQNIAFLKKKGSLSFRISKILILGFAIFSLNACIPTGNQEINTKLFKSKEDLKDHADKLKAGMKKADVFKQLNIPIEEFSTMSLQEVQASVYGNSIVRGTPDQLEIFKKKLMSYQGYSLPYREIKNSSSLGFGSMSVNKSGYDLKLVLIFEKGRLLRSAVEGNQNVNINDNQYLWNTILKKGTGIGF